MYPAHGAGSLCGKAISRETVSTIGEQRRVNYALQPMSREAFVALVSADQPDAPPYFTYDAVLNTREHQTLAATLDWSYQLLGEGERLVLRRLAIMAGSFTLTSAAGVAGGEGIDTSDVVDHVAKRLSAFLEQGAMRHIPIGHFVNPR